MKVLRFSFLGIVFAFIGGIVFAPEGLGDNAVLLVFIAICCLILWRFSNTFFVKLPYAGLLFYGVACMAFYLLGGFTVSSYLEKQTSEIDIEKFFDDEYHSVDIVVTERLKPGMYGERFIADIHAIDQQAVYTKTLIYCRDAFDVPEVGQRWLTIQKLSPILGSRRPGEFDYARYMKRKGIYFYMPFSMKYSVTVNSVGLYYKWVTIRKKLMQDFESYFNSDASKSLALALLFGERQELEDNVLEDFRKAGVMHVLAISGLHVGILYFFIAFLTAKVSKMLRFISIQLVLWAFVFLAGVSASVFRAALMFTVMAIAGFFNRNPMSYTNWALALLLSLSINPMWLYDVGFQMSYAAVLSILFFYPIFKPFLLGGHLIWRYLKGIMGISIAAQLGVLPLLMYYFGEVSLGFLLGNMVALSLIGILLNLLFAGFVMHLIWEEFARVLLFLFEHLTTAFLHLIHWVSKVSFTLTFHSVSRSEALAVFIVIGTLGFLLQRVSKFRLYLFVSVLVSYQGLLGWNAYQENFCRRLWVPFQKENLVLEGREGKFNYKYEAGTCMERECGNTHRPLSKVMIWKGKRILILDSLGLYTAERKPNILIFANKPKLFYKKVLDELEPEMVVVHNTVARWDMERIKRDCKEKKIPFHAVAEKGFYEFE